MPDSERVLALLRELQAVDADAGAVHHELHVLLEQARVLRGDTLGLQSFWSAWLPAERERRHDELARARDKVTAARAVLVEAEGALREVSDDERRGAELFEVRARDRLSVAERLAAEAEAAVEELESAERLGETRQEELQAKAKSLAAALRSRPRVAGDAGVEPGPGLDEVLAWAETAEAALFVAHGQAAAEREAVIRQANELGSAALGEPLGSASVAVVARRIAQSLS